MEVLLGVALAVVFAVSGGAKLLDRAGTREAVAGFRQGERSFISVVQEVRGLQERCSG